LGVNFLTLPLGECLSEKTAVFVQDLRVSSVAEALEERSRALDVGEEEGDRPGRQAFHKRPFSHQWGRVQLGATFGE
jgi:hypothetical protein